MMETSPLVIEIIERASTLRERLSGEFVPSPSASSARVDELLDEWCRVAAKGDLARFDRRLALDGLDRSRIRAALGPVRLTPGGGIPEWARLLQRYIAMLTPPLAAPHARDTVSEETLDNGDRDVPFAELFTALARLADVDLASHAGAALEQVSPSALAGLRSSLVRRLARVAAPLLYERFEQHRSECRQSTGRSRPYSEACHAASRRIYRDFVRRMLDGGMAELLHEYPVLARIMATSALLWRDATSEFLARLAEDRDAIAERFARGGALGDLVGVSAGISDPHRGGRTVHSLTFACGLRLVYKPRGLGVDAAFGALLQWLVARGAPLAASRPAVVPSVLDRGDHGWAEFLERGDCGDRSAVRRYYQYAGSLLCLLHMLGSTDCHYENIMAVGDLPVVIDLETVLQPEIERAEPPADRARNIGARRLYDDSVLRTGMLPSWQAAGDLAYDIGGLSACGGQVTQFRAAVWSHVNTDAMHLSHQYAEVGAHLNVPLLGGVAAPPTDHVEDIVLGFSRMYEWLRAHADSLLAPDGPVARLAREEVRFIARPSSVYDHVLRRSLRSDALREGSARSVELELLARGLLPLAPSLWPLLREEQRALEQLDIPIFAVRGDASTIALGARGDVEAGAPALPVARSGLDVARSRFASLSPGDLALQLQVIRGSFALRSASEERVDASAGVDVGASPADAAPEVCTSTELLAAAREIAGDIQQTVLTDSEGHPTWITFEPISTSGHCRLQATGYGLYDGLAGIAIFLAAAARCCDSSELALLARRALEPLRHRLYLPGPTFADELGIGGACGSASVVYTLLRVGLLLDDDSLMHDAGRAAEQMTPAAIAADSRYDVLYGAAGALLALLALHRASPASWLLERALDCGSHLLANRCAAQSGIGAGHKAWRTVGGRMLAGFAHGAAGIAYALLRLHAVTGCTSFREAALDAICYEDSLFDEDHGQWRDLRAAGSTRGPSNAGVTWCHGAVGIGLGRLRCLDVCNAADLRLGLERAIVAIGRADFAPPSSPDHLCCGSSGAIELLLATGLEHGLPALVAAAHSRASAMVRRRLAVGAYRLLASPVAGVHDPALYRGTAGIGYGLLRLCRPEMLPSLLLWD